ncbi:rhodanese-related sulfurtransferase [Bacillus sp. SLBN-46]|jgi:rhodanese-related sulfurtransferase|uniref:rhodanese-like domain-containing protein n=1 Tax=Bacillus sp. SLBN-46 TaxID=3042283 RepID=UPI00286572A9|nr:rhodanese-like domain-containing protein [Bacillus sp. SLBN-46]MDR6121770.1 rhodanese-related sulfurtransferase [Bacillus sp. SLBN-46]
MKIFLSLSSVILLIFLSACGISTEGYRNVSSEEAKKLIDNKKVVVLDVRTPEEYQEGHIPNSKLVPLQELESSLNELEKEKPYLVVCRSGNRSAQASEILTSNRFSKIYNMTGGMNTWGYDIEKE